MKGTLEFVIESARAVFASLAISHEVETGFINAEEEFLRNYSPIKKASAIPFGFFCTS